MNRTAKARARTNIALVKYWGKRDSALNLPAVGSISMTLSSLCTTTEVAFDDRFERDELSLNGMPAHGRELERVSMFLDAVRNIAGLRAWATVSTENNFPTASGLASSASGFAALAAASVRAAGLDPSFPDLVHLTRMGSGSATRSLLGGFVELPAGVRPDGTDAVPREILPCDAWDIRLVIAVNGRAEKPVSSTEGMERTRATSPYYARWVGTHETDMVAAADAIRKHDLTLLGETAEASCFKMHAAIMASVPPIVYWNGATVEAMTLVWRMRRERHLGAYVTIDAGSHVKVLCPADQALEVAAGLREVEGIDRVLVERPGPGVEILK